MDNNSTPGEVKRMVKFAMGHANYQGSMTGETISGIYLLDGAVALTQGNGSNWWQQRERSRGEEEEACSREKVEEEMKKKSDEEKAQAIDCQRQWITDQETAKAKLETISPPNPDIALDDGPMGRPTTRILGQEMKHTVSAPTTYSRRRQQTRRRN